MLAYHKLQAVWQVSYKLFIQIKNRTMLFFLCAYCAISLVANTFTPQGKRFPALAGVLFIMCLIFFVSWRSLRYFETRFSDIRKEMAGDVNLLSATQKSIRMQCSPLTMIPPVLTTIFFSTVGLLLFNAAVSLLVLCLVMLGFIVTVTASIIGYMQYIYLAMFVYDVAYKIKSYARYESNYPSETRWLQKLSSLCLSFQNRFFFLGSLYIVSWAVYSHSSFFGVGVLGDALSMALKILGWAFIAIFIPLAFPAITSFEGIAIKAIVAKLKAQRVKQLNAQRRSLLNNQERLLCDNLIIALHNTPDLPQRIWIQKAYNWLNGVLNIAATVAAVIPLFSGTELPVILAVCVAGIF